MSADGHAQMLPVFHLKCSIGKMGQGKAILGMVGVGEPALPEHGGMIIQGKL